MLKPEEFTSLQEARDYTVTEYSEISSNQAIQFAAMSGILDALESETTNDTVVSVIEGKNTTVKALAKAAIVTLNNGNGNFATDPNTPEGQLNRLAMSKIPLMSQWMQQTFFSLGEKTYKPYENLTLHEYLIHKGECPKKSVSHSGGWVTFTTNVECEKHSPRLLVQDGPVLRRINNVKDVSSTGTYHVEVPSKYLGSSLFLDDPYGVI